VRVDVPRPGGQVELYLSAAEIAARIEALASEIAARLGPEPMIVAVLKGSLMFTADLMRALHHNDVRPQIDFITLSSYGVLAESSGKIRILRDITDDVAGREVLLIDDILETGRTIAFAKAHLLACGAKSVSLCVLLRKPARARSQIEADFVGFETPDLFVVGYGLDYAHHYRELPFIGVLRTL
jgi:hypoxanthine phosphoribosyltransferase